MEKKAPGAAPRAVEGIFDRPILPMIVRLSAPIFAGMFVQFLYNLTDTFFISLIDRLDPSYVGGTGIVFPIVFFAIALANGIQVGVSSLVARAIGERNQTVLGRTMESGLAIAVVVSAVMLAAGYLLASTLIGLLGAQGDYFIHAHEYLTWVMPSLGLMFVSSVFTGTLQGEGRMKYAMIGMVIGTVANIILDPLLMFGLGMKVRGAALATVIAQVIATLYILSVFLRQKTTVAAEWKVSNVNADTMGKVVAVGLPQAVTQIVMSMSFLAFNRIVIGIDPEALTSFTLNGRIEQIVLLPIFAIGSAMITLAGQNAGRGLFDRVAEVWRKGALSSALIVVCVAAVLFAAAPKIYPVFTDIQNVIDYSVTQTRIMVFTFAFAVLGIQGRSVFLAVGHPLPALFLTLLRLVALALPAVLILVYVAGLGMYGVWIGLAFGNVVSGIVSLLWTNRTVRRLREGKFVIART